MTDVAPEMVEVLPESPLASFTGVSFSGQRRKVPHALKDYIPHSLVGLPSHLRPASPKPMPPAELEVPSLASMPDAEQNPNTEFTSEPNNFGLY